MILNLHVNYAFLFIKNLTLINDTDLRRIKLEVVNMIKKFKMMAAGLAAVCFMTSMSGCAPSNRMPQGTTINGTITRQGTNLAQELTRGVNPNSMVPGTGTGNLTGNPGTTVVPGRINTKPLAFDVQKSNNIMKNMGTIDGTRNIKAIVNGSTALVGYTPSGTMRNTLATKSAITKKVKSLDKSITNVVVTDSADIMNSINRLANDIKSNKVGSSLNNTFNQLVNKVKTS